MTTLDKVEDSAPSSREPLIVEVPTVLTRIDAQLRAQSTTDGGSTLGEAVGSSATTVSSITCARLCGATLTAEIIDGTDVILIMAERKGWLGPLTSGWYCPCCCSPECVH